MRNLFLLFVLAITLNACTQTSGTVEKKLFGKWMTSDQQYNREHYTFKPDGTFTDAFFANSPFRNSLVPETWEVANNKLLLRYKYHVLLFSFHRNASYNIIRLNDSVLVIGTRATKHYPARNMAFKKMKLNGKFITS